MSAQKDVPQQAGGQAEIVASTKPSLLEAARAFHNITIADPEVNLRCATSTKRDVVIAAGERLRVAIASALVQPQTEAQTEYDKLVEFFRREGYLAFGLNGDNMGWTPAETAINAMRKMLAAPTLPDVSEAEAALFFDELREFIFGGAVFDEQQWIKVLKTALESYRTTLLGEMKP